MYEGYSISIMAYKVMLATADLDGRLNKTFF